jgi:hypothetical protein
MATQMPIRMPTPAPPAERVNELTLMRLVRETGASLEELDQAGWTVLTRRGWPVAFMAPVDWALERLSPVLTPIAALRSHAHRSLGEGTAVAVGGNVLCSPETRHLLERLPPHRRGRVIAALRARGSPVFTRPDLAFADPVEEGLLLYAVCERGRLLADLVGPVIAQRMADRRFGALLHGRW